MHVLLGQTRSGVLWQNAGTADIYDRATKDAQWLTFQSNGVVDDLENYVPVGTLVNTTRTTASAPQPEFAAANWFQIPTHHAKLIHLQYLSKVTQVTGGGNLTVSACPLRIFGFGLMSSDDDPDFNYPPLVANSLVDGIDDTVLSRQNNLFLLRAVSTDALQWSSNIALSGELDLSVGGLVHSTNLATPTNLRCGWEYFISARGSGKVIATALDNDLITPNFVYPYQKIFLQVHVGVTSAAPANQVDTLRVKGQLKLTLMW